MRSSQPQLSTDPLTNPLWECPYDPASEPTAPLAVVRDEPDESLVPTLPLCDARRDAPTLPRLDPGSEQSVPMLVAHIIERPSMRGLAVAVSACVATALLGAAVSVKVAGAHPVGPVSAGAIAPPEASPPPLPPRSAALPPIPVAELGLLPSPHPEPNTGSSVRGAPRGVPAARRTR